MGRPPKQQPRGYIALFATILIVGGVVAVAFISAAQKRDPVSKESSAVEVKKSALDHPPFLLVDGQGARIIVNGQEKKLHWSDDVKLLGQAVSTLQGHFISTGENASLESEFILSSALHSPDGRRTAVEAGKREDATSSIEVRYGTERRVYILRLANGMGIRDAKPLGWLNDETIAISGLATSTRAIYALNLTGATKMIAQLPEFIERLRVFEGAVFYVLVTPGDGLEQPDQPPTELHRVTLDGKDETVATSEGDVIVAYASKGGLVKIKTEQEKTSTPIVYLNDTILLTANDARIYVRDLVIEKEIEILTFEKDAAVFPLPNVTVENLKSE